MTQSLSALEARVRNAVQASIQAIAPEADFAALDARRPWREELDLDSYDFLNVLIGLHERLGVEVPEADYGRIATFDALLGYLLQRLQPSSSQARAPDSGGAAAELLKGQINAQEKP